MNNGEFRGNERAIETGLDDHIFDTNTVGKSLWDLLMAYLCACLMTAIQSVNHLSTSQIIQLRLQLSKEHTLAMETIMTSKHCNRANKWKLWKAMEGNGILDTSKL